MTAQRRQLKSLRLSGVNADIPATLLPEDIYTQVVNVEAFDIGVRASRGNAEAYGTPLFAPEHLVYNKSLVNFFWIYASSAGIGVTDGQAHFDITPTVPPITSTWPAGWTDAQLNGLVCLNNQIDAPWFWDGVTANIMQAIPGWPVGTTCGALRAYNYNLIALGIDGPGGLFANQLMWSNSSDPGLIPDSWTPLPTNDAGDNVLSDTIGALIDGQQFRDSFLLMKEHSTYIMNFIGGNFVFNFRKLFTTSGILTQGCSTEFLGNVVILTDGDLIRTDGQMAESLIDKRMRQWLFNNIDSNNYKQAFVTSFHAENQVWCCFPETGADECTLALIWDASDNKFGVRELKPQTAHVAKGQVGNVTAIINWDDDPEQWNDDLTSWNSAAFNPTEDALLQADRSGSILFAVNEGTTYDGETIHSRVERIGLDFGDVERIKLVKAIAPRITGQVGTVLTIRVGSSANDANVVNWSPPQTFTIGDNQKVDTFAQGRFLAFSVESDADQAPWVLMGMEFQFDWQGYV